jgi:uncharacterized protein YlxP (DUF503 family)
VVVGILSVTIDIPGADSLKDKRQVLKSLLEHLRQKFGVSAAEVAENDSWRRAVLGVACVSNDVKSANRVLDKAADYVESNPAVSVVSIELEFV